MEAYLVLATLATLFIFVIYLMIDFFFTKGGANAFFDKWVRKTLWMWLPFYALQRLIKEVILKENKK